MVKLDPLAGIHDPNLKKDDKNPHCVTAEQEFLYRTATHCLIDGPKLYNFRTLFMKDQDSESKAFSKSIRSNNPGIFCSSVNCIISYINLVLMYDIMQFTEEQKYPWIITL